MITHLRLLLSFMTLLAANQLFAASTKVSTAPARERILFNDDWRFTKGDPDDAGTNLNYANLREWLLPCSNAFREGEKANPPKGEPGTNISYTQPDFADLAWQKVTLPHDWAIAGPFSWDLPGETAKLPWAGTGCYRKHFTVKTNDSGKLFTLEVDGAMAYASVWLNGEFVGGWPYGYASWQLDLTPHLKFGGDNVLAIRLENPPESSRWYPGSGLYRNVWLTKTSPLRVGQWGVFVPTLEADSKSATVAVLVNVENLSKKDATLDVETMVFELDASGKKTKAAPVVLGVSDADIAAGKSAIIDGTITLSKPKLWSVANPNRYVAVTSIKQSGKVVDTVETPFGIRMFKFTADNGFILNGKRVPIRGVCNHHDLGALGTAFNTRAAERQLELLKAMGCNAIRTSHNPPAPELLDLCDRMGFLVMDEAFDAWRIPKKQNDYHLLFDDWHEADVRAFIRRDRNHPSVVLWSIGNEIPEQGKADQFPVAQDLADIARSEDPTRPVTAGCNWEVAGFNGFQEIVDVFGYNYKPQLYEEFRKKNPSIPLYASETASTISSRGEYFFPVVEDKSQGKADFQMSSYDLYAERWATTPDMEFRGQDSNSFVAGEFVWTGFDYLGEPTPYNDDLSNLNNYSNPADRERAEKELKEFGKIRSPARSSYFGILDLAGFPKDRYYLYQARWRPDLTMAHILPHWTWPGREGEITPVHVYTSGDEAELFLNGKSLGRKKRGEFEYRLRWDNVKYSPGKLKVVTYKNGKRWATDTVQTATAATKLVLKADHSAIAADGRNLSFVTVQVEDKSGTLVPRANNLISFSITGPGEIVAVDNGNATSFESFQASQRKAYNGLALVIIRAKPGQTGKIRLTAQALGLKTAQANFVAK